MFLLTSIAWPYRGLRYRPTEFECFWKVSADKLILFKWPQAQVQFFLKCVWNKSCSWAALLKCWFRTEFGRENSSAFYITCREGNRFWLFSLSRVDHALRPILMFWLVKIWQVSSRGKFLQRLETCLLSWQSFVREFCLILRCFKLSFSTWCTKWNTAAIKIVL